MLYVSHNAWVSHHVWVSHHASMSFSHIHSFKLPNSVYLTTPVILAKAQLSLPSFVTHFTEFAQDLRFACGITREMTSRIWCPGEFWEAGIPCRSSRVVDTFEQLLGGEELYHYHSKLMMKEVLLLMIVIIGVPIHPGWNRRSACLAPGLWLLVPS